MPTIIPFHRVVLDDAAFTAEPFSIHTRWIETEWAGSVEPYGPSAEGEQPTERERVTVEVGGRRLEVSLPAGLSARSGGSGAGRKPPTAHRAAASGGVASGDALVAPMQGTIVKVAVEDGQLIEAGDLVVVLEAMKMEQPINAHQSGKIGELSAAIGDVVSSGTVLCTITSDD
jgi:acetyl-CoA/propionyl-CoA carboxylase biotin carboxyl carrier protein